MNKRETIGNLRHRATIQQYSTARDSYGQELVTYSSLATVWAAYDYRITRSDEQQLAEKKTAVATVNWMIRYRDDVEPKMRLTDEAGNIYDILSVNPDPMKTRLVLECQNVGLGGAIYAAPVPGDTDQRTYRQTFTGLSGQDVTITENGGTLPTNTDHILVFINGQMIEEWTVSGSVITITAPTLISSDYVTIQFWPSDERVYSQTFTNVTGDAVTVTENNGELPSNNAQIAVFVNGQYTEQWTHSGAVISFSISIDSGDTVLVKFWK